VGKGALLRAVPTTNQTTAWAKADKCTQSAQA